MLTIRGAVSVGDLTKGTGMLTVTADHIRVLARAEGEHPVLAIVDDQLAVLPADEVTESDRVLYTREALIRDCGEDVTVIEAEVMAGALSAQIGDPDPTEELPQTPDPATPEPPQP